MAVYSVVKRNPLLNIILNRASPTHALSVTLLYHSTELWVSKCQRVLECKGDAVVHFITDPRLPPPSHCRSVHLYTRQLWHMLSGGPLYHYFNTKRLVLLLKESFRRFCTEKFHQTLTAEIRTSPNQTFVRLLNTKQATEEILIGTYKNCGIPQLQIVSKTYACQHTQTRMYHSSAIVKAGHNKWSKVKHKKKFTDLEKSKTIHKYVTLITSAVKVGGGADPDSNTRLANIIESAKKAGVPKANIENAIKNASGKGAGHSSELVVYDAQGPSGYHMMIEAFTDNSRKTRPEIKNLLVKYSGILGEPGSSAFMFDHKGVIRVPECEFDASTDLLEVAIEVGAEDVQKDGNSEENILGSELSSNPDTTTGSECLGEQQYVRFFCDFSELTTVSNALKSHGYAVAGANLEYIPKSLIYLSQESYDSALKLVCALSEHSDVTEVYDNFTLQSSQMN